MVRVLTGSPLSSCAPSVGAGGLTLTIVRGPVKSTVRSASEGIYRPIRPLRRITWRLKCASRSSRTSGHRRVLSRRACGPMDRHAVTMCHDGESGEAAALTGDYALVLLDLRSPARPASTCSERSPRMKEPAPFGVGSDRAARAPRRARRPWGGELQPWSAVGSEDRVQPKSLKVPGVRAAPAVVGGVCERAAPDGLAAAGARDRGAIDQQQVVVEPRAAARVCGACWVSGF